MTNGFNHVSISAYQNCDCSNEDLTLKMLRMYCDCKTLRRDLRLSEGKLLCNNELYSINHRCHYYDHKTFLHTASGNRFKNQFIDLR